MEYSREQPPNPETRIVSLQSEIKSVDGEKKQIAIKLAGDGMPKAVAFFDIDGTLAELTSIHGAVIKEVFQSDDQNELAETFFAGFKLGNSFREFDRMHGIYVDGYDAWRDPEVYIRERLQPYRDEIDEPGNPAHERASQYLNKYSGMAAGVAKATYEDNPETFEEVKLKPIFHLAKLYQRLGIPMVGMTANGHDFAKAISTYLGLGELFVDVATDREIAGGGKERAMEYLIKELEEKGIKIPKDRLIIVGDSLRGDIGSALKYRDAGNVGSKSKGLLVLRDDNELLKMQRLIETDDGLKSIVSEVDTSALVIANVPLSKSGKPLLGSGSRGDFLTKL